MPEVIKVAIRAQAANDFGTRRRIEGKSLGTDGDFSVITHADIGLLTPDERPPRTDWNLAQDGTILGDGVLFGGVWGGSQLTVDFVSVGVRQQLIQEMVGPFKLDDAICGQ